jgi:alpha-1,2-mannosyltransferase
MLLAALRDAPWLTRRRIRDYAIILIAFYGLFIARMLSGPGLIDPGGPAKGKDFVSFWTVSSALHDGGTGDIYRPMQLAARERALQGNDDFYAFAYPPSALLIVYPLALLPYLWSLAVWLATGLGLYLQALWRILPQRLTLLAGLAFPAVFITLGHGQNALLSAGILASALNLLERRPAVAGALIGLLTYKPQLGLLIPLALACGGHWRALAAAAFSALGLAGLSLLLFGSGVWSDFLAGTGFTQAMLEQELVPYLKMQSVFAATRLLGGSLAFAYATQGVASLLAALVTAAIWRGSAAPTLKYAVLVVAGLLASPFLLDYDLTLLAPAIAWLAAVQQRDGIRPWEATVLAAACFAPLLARPLAELTGVIVTPAIEVALLAVLAARCGLLATARAPISAS